MSRPVVAADLLGEDAPDAELPRRLEGEDDAAGRRPGDEVDQRLAVEPATVRREEPAQLARRGRVLEDLELLDVRVAVTPALEQEVALAEGAGARNSASVGARSCGAALASSAGRTVVMPESTRAFDAAGRALRPVFDALRRRPPAFFGSAVPIRSR